MAILNTFAKVKISFILSLFKDVTGSVQVLIKVDNWDNLKKRFQIYFFLGFLYS